MEEVFDNFDSEATDIREENLLTKIWVKPTETLAYIIENCPQKYVIPLLVLGGIFRFLNRAISKDMGDTMSAWGVVAISIIVGGLAGWITFYIYAWAMSVGGKFINGSAEPEDFRTVIAWALIPSLCSLLLLIPKGILFGGDLFKSELTTASLFTNLMRGVFGLLELILSIWTLVILVKGVSLIQNFNTGKAILNILLPGLVIIVPIFLFSLLFN